jgi:hypothetical protein
MTENHGVPGSNPGSATQKVLQIAEKMRASVLSSEPLYCNRGCGNSIERRSARDTNGSTSTLAPLPAARRTSSKSQAARAQAVGTWLAMLRHSRVRDRIPENHYRESGREALSQKPVRKCDSGFRNRDGVLGHARRFRDALAGHGPSVPLTSVKEA